ncbi:hypothetical protein MASR2M78_09700 [Treponema sp.]
MKRSVLFLLVSIVLTAGCMTYRNFDKTEERQLSQEQVFKKRRQLFSSPCPTTRRARLT